LSFIFARAIEDERPALLEDFKARLGS